MSGWDFDDLHQIVRVSVRANADATPPCGCENRDGSWRLCMYHDGMQCAAELLTLRWERSAVVLGSSFGTCRSGAALTVWSLSPLAVRTMRPHSSGSSPSLFLAALLRQADREANRPGELALKAARDEGFEAGVRSAGYAARDLERLRGKVKEFEEATGLRVDAWDERLHEQAALVRVLLGDGRSWDGVMARLDRLAKVAGELHSDLAGLGLGRPK